jgi:uncharacterized DUF497 family protein
VGTYFEWDPDKAESNYQKHRVLFTEARSVFDDPLMLTSEDEGHSMGELRFRAMGRSSQTRLLVVVYTERADAIRIISA